MSAETGATAASPKATASLPGAPVMTAVGFVAFSRFVIANGMEAEVKAAFRERPHLVDRAAGFVRMEVLCPLDRPQEIWLLTHWRHANDYRAWHRGHAYRDSHRGIPKGLKLVGRETSIREFDVVCE
ncbi:MAG: antibiotic biosynthesis monooxygenase [Burkholderiaceae bacterium]|nr:antibiotic biosynthesis monooxygenase [Burkholderiaceae bacterium]